MTAPGGFAPNPQVLFRGATLLFSVTFGDASGNPINPIAAALNLTYQSLAENAQLTVAMALAPPGGGSFIWTAQWDTRGVGAGPVQGSVHSAGPAGPYAVGDFNFLLAANAANQPTF